MQLLAGRVGQLVNLSDLGNVVGVSYKTIESWLSVLEASYIVYRLEPYYKNFGKRITKSSKIFFTDIGLASFLLRVDTKEELQNFFALGGLFENLIIIDIVKRKLNRHIFSNLYFYRDSSGNEVDLIIDHGTKLTPIEIKASSTYTSDFLKGIHYFNNQINQPENKGYIVYSGNDEYQIQNIQTVNWQNLHNIPFE